MVCASHTDRSTILEDHNGALLVQNKAFMDLQQGFQAEYLTTTLSNQLSWNSWFNAKSVEILKKLPTRKVFKIGIHASMQIPRFVIHL
jgi:hypothetical protein